MSGCRVESKITVTKRLLNTTWLPWTTTPNTHYHTDRSPLYTPAHSHSTKGLPHHHITAQYMLCVLVITRYHASELCYSDTGFDPVSGFQVFDACIHAVCWSADQCPFPVLYFALHFGLVVVFSNKAFVYLHLRLSLLPDTDLQLRFFRITIYYLGLENIIIYI